MIAFWHSTSAIDDVTTFAQLSLSFEHVVVPGNDEGYFPHSRLKTPVRPAKLANYWPTIDFWPSSAREDTAFHSFSAVPSYEDAYERFGEKFADAQYEMLEVKNLKFEHYLRTAALNQGVLIGNTQLSDSDFKNWLTADFENQDQAKLLQLVQALLTFAGVRITLPNIAPEHLDELLRLKSKYPEEVKDYQAFIAELLDGTWDLIKSNPSYDEFVAWTQHRAMTKISPALRRLEAAIRTGDRKLLERIGYGLMTDLPVLVAGHLRGSNVSLLSSGMEAVLKVLAPNLAQSIRERRALESSFGLSYLYRLGKATLG